MFQILISQTPSKPQYLLADSHREHASCPESLLSSVSLSELTELKSPTMIENQVHKTCKKIVPI